MKENFENSLPANFPQKSNFEEAIFIRTELGDGEEPGFQIKRAKLRHYTNEIEYAQICEKGTSPFLDGAKHVHFTGKPPQQFFTFSNQEYDRRSTSPLLSPFEGEN